MWAIHAALVLAKHFEGSCLFNQHSLQFCKYKWGLEYAKNNSILNSFSTVFNTYLPEIELVPFHVLYEWEKCVVCAHLEKCKDNYLLEVEKNMKNILKWRNYDEVHQMKEVTNSIV